MTLAKAKQILEPYKGKIHNAKDSVGVYLLFKGMEIVYVGQSVHVQTRIYNHSSIGDKDFDTAAYIEVERDNLGKVERTLIKALRPRYNVSHNEDPSVFPVNLQTVISVTKFIVNEANGYHDA